MNARPRRHPRLASDVTRSWISIGVGATVAFAVLFSAILIAPESIRELGVTQLIRLNYYASWTLFCVIYIALSLIAFARLDPEQLRSLTAATDPGASRTRRAWWALNGGGGIWWALTGAAVTLFTLVELIASRDPLTPLLVGSSATVAVSTVALIIVAFAVNYAREDAVRGGFGFPGDGSLRFADYVYLSIQITTTFGGSDVQILRTRLRRLVSMHSLIAFTFNAVIVALLISVLVGSTN